jgi:hypothetical protein
VQTIHEPHDENGLHSTKMQESARKDIERCFGILQFRFAIIQNPHRLWQMDVIYDLVMCCVIFHNMINEDK